MYCTYYGISMRRIKFEIGLKKKNVDEMYGVYNLNILSFIDIICFAGACCCSCSQASYQPWNAGTE